MGSTQYMSVIIIVFFSPKYYKKLHVLVFTIVKNSMKGTLIGPLNVERIDSRKYHHQRLKWYGFQRGAYDVHYGNEPKNRKKLNNSNN